MLYLGEHEIEAVYIAGPMRGYPGFNFDAFQEAETYINQHFDVKTFNPARKDKEAGFNPEGLSGKESFASLEFDLVGALAWDLKRILYDVDALILLEGWTKSNGARAEFFLARALGKPAFELVAGNFWEVGDEL